MCGRYTLGPRVPGEFDARFGGHVDIRALRRYNVAPTEAVPVVRRAPSGGPAGSGRETVNAHWGLLPPWATSRRERLKPINARVETLSQKKLFAPLVTKAEHRVLVLADGWYEWMRREDPGKRSSGPDPGKVPFHHTVDGGEPIAFAGLAREVRLRDGPAGLDPVGRPYGGPGVDERTLISVAIVTCAASPAAARLHDRMPAVLAGPDEEAAWLSPDVDGRDATALCVPLADERLRIAPASPLVNSVRSADGPWLLDPEVSAAPDDDDPTAAAQTQLDLTGPSDA
ncbi:MAG: SOS response-associated peptidase [Patulibacter sp.]|nr:SOS response-associated peptidase [Patulibacter sp.]